MSHDYYDTGGISTIDVIKAKLTTAEYIGFLKGNILKYTCRMSFKGQAVGDAQKLAQYSGWLAVATHEQERKDAA